MNTAFLNSWSCLTYNRTVLIPINKSGEGSRDYFAYWGSRIACGEQRRTAARFGPIGNRNWGIIDSAEKVVFPESATTFFS